MYERQRQNLRKESSLISSNIIDVDSLYNIYNYREQYNELI